MDNCVDIWWVLLLLTYLVTKSQMCIDDFFSIASFKRE
jgi:hypothetical protein